MPALRIIDQDLWDAVKAKQGEINSGGGISMVSTTQLGCSTARNKSTCDNRLTLSRAKLEEAVLHALQAHLMDDALCAAFCEEYTKEVNRIRIEHNANLENYRPELAKLERKKERLLDLDMKDVIRDFRADKANRMQLQLAGARGGGCRDGSGISASGTG